MPKRPMRKARPTLVTLSAAASLAALLLCSTHAARAAVVPTGDSLLLGTSTMSLEPAQVAWAGDRFAVVVEVGDASPGRILLHTLAPGSSTIAHTVEVAEVGASPAVAAFPDGSLVVLWTDYADWFARFVDADGDPAGDPMPLGLESASRMRVVAGAEGNWTMVFQEHDAELQQTQLRGWRFAGTEPMSEEPFTIGVSPLRHAAAMLPDNRFFAAWSEKIWHDDCDDCGFECCYDWTTTYVHGRGYDVDGTPTTGPALLGNDFHHDEQGDPGLDLAALGTTGFVGAWLDSFEMDYPQPTYLVLRTFDAQGGPASASRVLDGFETDAEGTSVVATSEQLVLAVSVERGEQDGGQDIQLYSTSLEDGPVEKTRLETPDSPFEHAPLLATDGNGSLLLVWTENVDLTPANRIHARPFFAAASIVCGDATLDGRLRASDALSTLKAAVGSRYCALPVCDATGDGEVAASDASRILGASVGMDADLLCPPTGTEVPAPIPNPWW